MCHPLILAVHHQRKAGLLQLWLWCVKKRSELIKRISGLSSLAQPLEFTKGGKCLQSCFCKLNLIIYLSEAGEHAFGRFEDPLFVRTSTREYANQIFVDGYMKLLVIRYAN